MEMAMLSDSGPRITAGLQAHFSKHVQFLPQYFSTCRVFFAVHRATCLETQELLVWYAVLAILPKSAPVNRADSDAEMVCVCLR